MPYLYHAFVSTVADSTDSSITRPSEWNARLQYGNFANTGPSGTDAYIHETLTADRTYYVLTTGNDANSGLANTSTGAKLTLQAAWNAAANIDCFGFNVTIQLGSGVFSGRTVMNSELDDVAGSVKTGFADIIGADALGGTVLTQSASDTETIFVGGDAHVNLKNLQLRNDGSGTGASCLWVRNGGAVNIDTGVIFSSAAGTHVLSQNGATVVLNNAYSIVGGALNHFNVLQNAQIEQLGLCTLTGSLTFTKFAEATNLGSFLGGGGFTGGTIAGTRYNVTTNAVLNTQSGADPNHFPGNVGGTFGSGGQYL